MVHERDTYTDKRDAQQLNSTRARLLMHTIPPTNYIYVLQNSHTIVCGLVWLRFVYFRVVRLRVQCCAEYIVSLSLRSGVGSTFEIVLHLQPLRDQRKPRQKNRTQSHAERSAMCVCPECSARRVRVGVCTRVSVRVCVFVFSAKRHRAREKMNVNRRAHVFVMPHKRGLPARSSASN